MEDGNKTNDMKRNKMMALGLIMLGFIYACNNTGDATGTTDTSVNIGVNSSGTVDTGINGTNGNMPNTPDTSNNYLSPARTQQDTLNRQ
jgi:hypothetical protein